MCATSTVTSLPPTRSAARSYSQLFDGQDRPPNVARFVFLDPRATTFVDWDEVANQIVAAIHAQAGRDPYDRRLTDLIGELSTRSEVFRVRRAAHNVRHHDTGLKRFHHPVVGQLELSYEALPLPAPRTDPRHLHRRGRLTSRGDTRASRQVGRNDRAGTSERPSGGTRLTRRAVPRGRTARANR
jgi:hypothetical protein